MNITSCYTPTMDTKDPFCVALNHLIKNTDATQTSVAEYIGMKQPYISDLKNGRKKGPPKTWAKIAEYFEKTPKEFEELGFKLIANSIHDEANNISNRYIDVPMDLLKNEVTVYKKSPQDNTCPTCGGNIKELKNKRHHQIIDTFHNHELAVEINQLLVRLEQLEDDDGLKAALEWAKYRVYEAEKKRGLPRQANGTEDK